MPNDKTQKQKFIDAAKRIESDTNESVFNNQVKTIAPKRKKADSAAKHPPENKD